MFRDFPQRDPAMEKMLCSVLAFASVSLWGESKAMQSTKATDIPSWEDRARGTSAQSAGRGSWDQEVHQVRGSQSLAVEFHVFTVFLTQGAYVPHKKQKVPGKPSPSCFSVFLRPRDVFLLWWKWQWEEMQFPNLLTSPVFKFLISWNVKSTCFPSPSPHTPRCKY